MNAPIRHSVRVLLFNKEGKLLLMHIDDPKTTDTKGNYYGSFWNPIGGAIEQNESLQKAALRETYEETGILLSEDNLGPTVWYGAFDLMLNGKLTHIQQTYIIAKTHQSKFSLENLTSEEKVIVQKLKWFTFEDIHNCEEIIYPIVFVDYIAEIFAGKLPNHPIEIDLSKQPDKKTRKR